jgi:hypothetical protein
MYSHHGRKIIHTRNVSVKIWGQEEQTQLHEQASDRWMNQEGWGQHWQGTSWVENLSTTLTLISLLYTV